MKRDRAFNKTFIDDITTLWTPGRFRLPRRPLTVGIISERAKELRFKDNRVVIDMPIKLPGQTKVTLPDPFASDPYVLEFLARTEAYEKQINKDWLKCYFYLTVIWEYCRAVERPQCLWNDRDLAQRGPHMDGFQAGLGPRLPACHTYAVDSAVPATFYTQSLNADGLNQLHHNFNVELAKQINPASESRLTPSPYEIIVYSAYQLHAYPEVTVAGMRYLIKLDVSYKEFNRLGAAKNDALDPGWREYRAHHLPALLIAKRTSVDREVNYCHCGTPLYSKTAVDCIDCFNNRYRRYGSPPRDETSGRDAELYNLAITKWCNQLGAKLHFEDFVFRLCAPCRTYATAEAMEFTFYSPKRHRFLRCGVPMSKVAELRDRRLDTPLQFRLKLMEGKAD